MVATSLSISLLLVFVTAACAKRYGFGGAFVCCGIAAGLFFCLSAPAVALHAFFSLLALVLVLPFRAKVSAVTFASVVAGAVAYGLLFAAGTAEIRRVADLRAKYPLRSIVARLAHESRAERKSPLDSSHVLSVSVETRLAEYERDAHGSGRTTELFRLHEGMNDDFLMARGFGPVRMRDVRLKDIWLPEKVPLPADSQQYSPSSSDEAGSPLAQKSTSSQGSLPQETLLGLHDAGLADFLDPDRLGYVRDRDHVAGFLGHGFSRAPALPPATEANLAWKVVRLELVSLLRHATPVVYVSEFLPQMDRLDELALATRPLDAFEQQALVRLRADEDVVIEDAAERIRMVGSLRASKICLECHTAERGELLGAFTYELRRAGPAKDRPAKVENPLTAR